MLNSRTRDSRVPPSSVSELAGLSGSGGWKGLTQKRRIICLIHERLWLSARSSCGVPPLMMILHPPFVFVSNHLSFPARLPSPASFVLLSNPTCSSSSNVHTCKRIHSQALAARFHLLQSVALPRCLGDTLTFSVPQVPHICCPISLTFCLPL